jgi:uncharacterized protein YutE (UPF0331/DUF86 family)
MGRVDREVVRQRLERMLTELDRIEQRRPSTLEEYSAPESENLRYELEHRMFIALQAMLDASAHLAVAEGVRDLMSSRDAILAMARLGVANTALVERLEGVAGLRNALAHEYLRTDDASVFDSMCAIDDVRQMVAAMWEWTETRGA